VLFPAPLPKLRLAGWLADMPADMLPPCLLLAGPVSAGADAGHQPVRAAGGYSWRGALYSLVCGVGVSLGASRCRRLTSTCRFPWRRVPRFKVHLTPALGPLALPLHPRPAPLLQVRAPRVEEISSVESSMRLDAVASAGFRMSRGKMTDLVKAGE